MTAVGAAAVHSLVLHQAAGGPACAPPLYAGPPAMVSYSSRTIRAQSTRATASRSQARKDGVLAPMGSMMISGIS